VAVVISGRGSSSARAKIALYTCLAEKEIAFLSLMRGADRRFDFKGLEWTGGSIPK